MAGYQVVEPTDGTHAALQRAIAEAKQEDRGRKGNPKLHTGGYPAGLRPDVPEDPAVEAYARSEGSGPFKEDDLLPMPAGEVPTPRFTVEEPPTPKNPSPTAELEGKNTQPIPTQGFTVEEPPSTDTKGVSRPSRGYSENLQRYLPQTMVPPQTRGPGSTEALDPLLQTITAPLAAVRDTVLGGTPRETADKLFGPPSTDWRENVLPGTTEAILDLLPTLPFMALGGRKGPSPGPSASPSIVPTVLSRENLDATVAQRGILKDSIGTGATVDPALVPPRTLVPEAVQKPFNPTAQFEDSRMEYRANHPVRTPDGTVLPNNFRVDNTADGLSFPSLFTPTRILQSGLDTLGHLNPEWSAAKELILKAYSNRATNSTIQLEGMLEEMYKITGHRPSAKPTVGKLLNWEHTAVRGAKRELGLTEKEMEQVYNDMYTGGRLRANTPKTQQLADTAFERGTYPASAHPGIRGLDVFNPLDNTHTPVGSPSKFMPQRPLKETTAAAIPRTKWEILYQRAGGFEKTGVSLDGYINQVVALSRHDPEVAMQRMKGLEFARLVDLEALGPEGPYYWAKKLGYETDFLVNVTQFNSMATLRGELELIHPAIEGLRQATFGQPGMLTTPVGEWVGRVLDNAFLKPQGAFDMLQSQQRLTRTTVRALNMMSLHYGGLAQYAQMAYPFARGTIRSTLGGTKDFITGADKELVKNSGAVFQSLINEFNNPTGPLAIVHNKIMHAYGIPLGDRQTRVWAAFIGNRQATWLEQQLLKTPQSKATQAQIRELGVDPKVILEQGKLPDDMRLRMIQRFADNTAGMVDVRGLPLHGLSENPAARLVQLYWRFQQSNNAELVRLVRDAPNWGVATARLSKLLIGSFALGSAVHETRNAIYDAITSEPEPRHKRDWIYHLKSLAMGVAGIPGMLLISAYESSLSTGLAHTMTGVGGGILIDFAKDLDYTMKHGPGWNSIKHSAPRIPLAGAVIGPYVKEQARKESKRQAERTREMSE